ncbi:MAG: cyclic nucleotide-binding domain-containing protein [Candidatus Eutrophobiaceae bacterium]
MEVVKANDVYVMERANKEMIVREDEVGDCMYYIMDGSVEVLLRSNVSKRMSTVATLQAGQFFGQDSMLPDSSGKRNSSIRVLKTCKLLCISKLHVDNAFKLAQHKMDSPDLSATLHGALQDIFKGHVNQEDDFGVDCDLDLDSYRKPAKKNGAGLPEHVIKAVCECPVFGELSEDEIDNGEHWIEMVDCSAGQLILREGAIGDCMYIIIDGTVEVFYRLKGSEIQGQIKIVARLSAGRHFGEQAALPSTGGMRGAWVRAKTHCHLLRIAGSMVRVMVQRDVTLLPTLSALGKRYMVIAEKANSGKL